VQKCCEVWYRKIVFFESERSQKLVLSGNKKERLRKIAIEAIEQCWGNIIPEIEYDDTINNIWWVTLVCHTQWAKSMNLRDLTSVGDINIVVWPEWWLSDDELQVLQNTWAQRVFFGERILRCETVGEVVWFYMSQK
jgi:RsmE family RNA methyltransferase